MVKKIYIGLKSWGEVVKIPARRTRRLWPWAYGEKNNGGANEKGKTKIFLNFDKTLVNAKIISNTKLLSKDYWKCFGKFT